MSVLLSKQTQELITTISEIRIKISKIQTLDQINQKLIKVQKYIIHNNQLQINTIKDQQSKGIAIILSIQKVPKQIIKYGRTNLINLLLPFNLKILPEKVNLKDIEEIMNKNPSIFKIPKLFNLRKKNQCPNKQEELSTTINPSSQYQVRIM